MEDNYFDSVLTKAILLAPCIYASNRGYDYYAAVFPKARESGINVVNSVNWKEDLAKLCATPDS